MRGIPRQLPQGRDRQMVEKEKRIKNVTIKSTLSLSGELEEIAVAHQRSVSQVAYLLVQRGLELYRQDGLLVEPVNLSVRVVETTDQESAAQDEGKGRKARRRQAR